MNELLKLLFCFVFLGPLVTEAQQDKMQRFSDGPKDIKKYLTTLKHRKDSIESKNRNEDRLRTFFYSTIYEWKRGSVVIIMGEGPSSIINECSHDTAAARPFVKFVSEKAIDFFCLNLFWPNLKKSEGHEDKSGVQR